MCEPLGMEIAELRAELGLSLDGFAKALGLSSKGYVSQLERGEVKCSVRAALEIERLSGGRIAAASLNADVGLVDAARRAALPSSGAETIGADGA